MNRKPLLYLAAGLGLVVMAVAAVPLLVPTGTIRGEIERRVAAATGRAFHINGSLAFTLFPYLGLSARDVTLANAPGGLAPDILRVDTMHIAVKFLPLLSGRVEADTITLDKPRIALEVAPNGAANWKLTPARGEGGGARVGVGIAAQTVFSGIVIEDGTLSYDNRKLGVHRALSGLDAKVSLTRLEAQANASGSFTQNGRKLDFTAILATPASLLSGHATTVRLALKSDFLDAAFIGTVASDGTIAGAASLHTPSLKDVAAWQGHAIAAGRGLGPLDFVSDVAVTGNHLAFSRIRARLDGMNLGGGLNADVGGKRPRVDGTLNVDRLDLNTYLGPAAQASQAHQGAPPGNPAAPHAPPAGGWSKAPIRLDLIGLLDGRLVINAGALDVLHLKLGKTGLAVTLAGGTMSAHLAPIQLYGGSGTADLIVDNRGAVPRIANRLVFANIAMRPFLADTIGVDKVEGPGSIALDITSTGGSPDAIMRALSGRGAVTIGRGTIHGVDFGQVARSIATLLSAGATAQGAVTDFDRFGGSFTIAKGMLSNTDLKLSSAFFNMTGRGQLDLGNQTIVYRIDPKASIGGRLKLIDVGVPFDITGSWSHLNYRPDMVGAVTGLVDSVISKGTAPFSGLLESLTGGGKKPSPPKPQDRNKKNKSTGDKLKSIFGLH